MGKRRLRLLYILLFFSVNLMSQQAYNLQRCLQYALENNSTIRKSKYDFEKSVQARREVLGALLPQINGTGSLNNNIQKSRFIMPNFINSMLPAAFQDPDAAKYMTIEMGTNYSAAIGATLNQQVINFSLFNALEIAKTAENLTALSVEAKEEDVIAQTANLFYAVQVTDYAVGLFGKSIDIIDSMLSTMETNYKNGLVRKIDYDRLKVTRINLLTQKSAMKNTVDVQKNLLKLQLGLDMRQTIDIEPTNLTIFEAQSNVETNQEFSIDNHTSFKLLEKQSDMMLLQRKAAVYESLPVLTAMANYNYNGVSDEFFKGETNYWYGSSLAGLSLRIPVFGGFSRSAKIKQADLEIRKIGEDVTMLGQSLNMAYINASMKLDDSRRTIIVQRENMILAEEVYRISESNFTNGLASMSDVLNANSSLIQSQMSYADALNNYMKASIDLRKASGTIKGLIE